MKTTIIGVSLVVAGLLIAPQLATDPIHEASPGARGPASLFFVGDIMLARDVENYLDQEGAAYPFVHVTDLLSQYDAVIGNFEGIVSDPHVKALPFTFQFSVRPEYLKGLKEAHFDILSLANNHSSDYGDTALELTKGLCTDSGLHCVGNARTAETFVYEVQGAQLGFLFANLTWGTESTETLIEHMQKVAVETDVQIAYMHWGTEYELVHNEEQETLAKALIDAGADAVIGHHPHVVQDVAFYDGVPIFYSLGNFIFDQYWNEHVQTGLGVEMRIEADQIAFRLIPFTQAHSRNQPMMLETPAADILLERILDAEGEGVFISTVDYIKKELAMVYKAARVATEIEKRTEITQH